MLKSSAEREKFTFFRKILSQIQIPLCFIYVIQKKGGALSGCRPILSVRVYEDGNSVPWERAEFAVMRRMPGICM